MKIMKRCFAILVALAMTFTITNYDVFAETGAQSTTSDSVKISVDSTYATPGTTVDINVKISGNTGILGATLGLNYSDKLTLIGAMQGEAFSPLTLTKPGKLQSPCQFIWDAQDIEDENIKDGTILTLTFKVDEDAQKGDVLDVKITSKYGDVIDRELNSVRTELESGCITVTDVTPGDLNEDGNINTMDIILMRRHIAGGYNININEGAADVNCDNTINTKDVILLRRYIAGGYGIVLPVVDPDACNHSLEHHDRKEATCTEDGNIEYWYCEKCGKYFVDSDGKTQIPVEETVIEAKGHTIVIDEAVEATNESTGLTEGSHCSTCGKVIKRQEEIPVLNVESYSITYYIDNNDPYLQQLDITNNNPTYYETEKGLKLTNLKVDGYTFDGWYDGEGNNATQIKEIAKGQTGDIELYAHWTLKQYTISFDSPLSPMESIKYTTNEGKTLSNPDWFGYTFMGWTDDDGNIVKRIPTGSTGNITLTANWISKRNQTRTVKNLGEPLIYEDEENGQYLFTYEIGQIENVPLYEIKNFGNRSGIDVSETITTSNSVSTGTANSIVNTIANSTTRTDSWTLSKEWNDSLTQIYSHTDESGREVIDSTSTVSSDSTVSVKGKTKSGSKGSTSSTEDNVSAKVGAKVGASYMGTKAEVSAEASASHTNAGSKSKNKSWGSENSTTKSHESSTNSTTSSALSSKVSDTYGYNKTHSEGGSEVHASSTSSTTSQSDEYASTLTYSNQETQTTTKTYSNANAPEGYYRLVCAGTIHVFAVVGYDIGTSSYYVYTYAVQDDKTYDFIDYSKDTPNFNDYENGVLPFEVPYFVNQYVDGVTSYSEGLIVDPETGEVVGYNGDSESVTIPRYYVIEDEDGNNDVIKITGITSSAFAGNDNITTVYMPDTITKLPNNAFKDCDNLEKVTGGELTEIGDNAFDGCSKLSDFSIKPTVTSIGNNAFRNVAKLSAKASSKDIVQGVVSSGAKSITLDLSTLDEEEVEALDNYKFIIPEGTEYFKLNGANREYTNMQIISKAETTVVSNCNFVNDSVVPLKLSSENITLSKVSAISDSYALISTVESELSLYGAVKIESRSDSAMLCRSTNLVWEKENAVGKLNVTGNIMVCGTIDGQENLTHTSGRIITVSETDFARLLDDSLEWVKESDVPQGATIVSEKWTYDLTTRITSDTDTVEGYTLYDSTYEWSSYGSWSGWSRNSVSSSDSRKVETRTVTDSNAYTESIFFYYKSPTALAFSYRDEWGGRGVYYQYIQRSYDALKMRVIGNYEGRNKYYIGSAGCNFSSECWFLKQERTVPAVTHKEYRYADRHKIYTYYLQKVENKESSVPIDSGDNVSNVQKWVKYVS